MDERGARARGELERRRQEAYRARAAATVKIQRWYRQHRAIRARTSTKGDAGAASTSELPAEESCAGSTGTSATRTTVSQQDIQGISPAVSNDGESVADSDDNPVQNRIAWSSASQLEERSNSFDEFVNSEVAVARAMVDDRYMENLNDAQKKRVERLKAYRKISGNQNAASETIGALLPLSSSNTSQDIAKEIPENKPDDVSKEVSQSVGKTKSLIPVRSTNKPLPNLHKREIEPAKKADAQSRPQMTTKVESVMQDVTTEVPKRRSKRNLSKPTSNQKKQWTMKEQHVAQKQPQTKEHRQVEQPDPIDQANDDTPTQSVKAIEDLVKIGGKSEMPGANDTNMQKEEGITTSEQTDVTSSSSSGGGTQVSQGTQTGSHTQKEPAIKLKSKGQEAGQKVLKFASNVMWQNSNSTVHDPSTEHSETRLRGIVKQPPHRITAEMDQDNQEEELPLLKKSSATTRLTLECDTEDEIQSDSASLLKRRHKNNEGIYSDSDSFLNLSRPRSSHRTRSKLNKHSTDARRQRIINAALADTDDTDSDDSSPEHLAHYADGQLRATRVSHGSTKFASQGGGYGAVYTKRRDTNRRRIIRSLRTPQCKPKEKKKEPAGYLQKFLHSSTAQNYLEAFTTTSAPPSYSSGKGSWHTAWTSMGGLPRPGVVGLRTPPEHSPPPQEWMSVMNLASSVSLFDGSYDSPLHHHLARRRRRPHHLHPLNAPAAGSKQMKTLKANHPKSYTYHYNQQQAVRHLGNHSQPLSHHRRSLSHVIPSSWRTELYYDSDNYYRGTF